MIIALVLGACTSGLEGDWECYEGKYKKVIDISTVKVGAPRAQIEKVLGPPIAKSDVKGLTAALWEISHNKHVRN